MDRSAQQSGMLQTTNTRRAYDNTRRWINPRHTFNEWAEPTSQPAPAGGRYLSRDAAISRLACVAGWSWLVGIVVIQPFLDYALLWPIRVPLIDYRFSHWTIINWFNDRWIRSLHCRCRKVNIQFVSRHCWSDGRRSVLPQGRPYLDDW